jgi:hypothetical protein
MPFHSQPVAGVAAVAIGQFNVGSDHIEEEAARQCACGLTVVCDERFVTICSMSAASPFAKSQSSSRTRILMVFPSNAAIFDPLRARAHA